MADEKKEVKDLWKTLAVQYVKGQKGKVVVKMIVDHTSLYKGTNVYKTKTGSEYLPIYLRAHVMVNEYVDFKNGKNKGVRPAVLAMPDQVRENVNKLADKVKGLFVSDKTTTKEGNPSKVVSVSIGLNLKKEDVDKAVDEASNDQLLRKAMGLVNYKIDNEIIPAYRDMVKPAGKDNKKNAKGTDDIIETVTEEIEGDER